MELEYKVVQSNTPMFAETSKMKQVLDEEAVAGWRLLEKLDNYKIRLQRDISHRANDAGLARDAYRTSVGVSSVVTYSITAVITISIVLAILYFSGMFG
jgi:hypothetical protein